MSTEGVRDDFIHVLIADSTRIHTQLLAEALQRDAELETVLAGPKVDDVIRASSLQAFDVAVISSSLADEPFGGLELLRALRDSHPNLRLIALLDSSKPELIVEAFRAGARGILSSPRCLMRSWPVRPFTR
jgi:DNA-binding NarL/FixJ family response regulator